MFTGIVQSQAEVYSIKTENSLSRLVLKVSVDVVENLQLGASISVNGVCLTVVSFVPEASFAIIEFDVIEESLLLTNLSVLSVGDRVNIERSLKVGDELGGHIVSGHVHCQSPLIARDETDTNCTLTFTLADKWKKYLMPKGFITVNGISLTVGTVENGAFSVHLIPETLSRTNLSALNINDKVNLEFEQQTMTIVTTIERMGITLPNS